MFYHPNTHWFLADGAVSDGVSQSGGEIIWDTRGFENDNMVSFGAEWHLENREHKHQSCNESPKQAGGRESMRKGTF